MAIEASKNLETKEWETVKLGEIASSIKGKRPKKLHPKNEEELIPYINIKAFETGEFDHFTTGEDCRLCDKGDILIVWDGSRSGLVGRAYKGAICSTIARIDIDGVINDYGYYFLLSNYQYLNTNTKGSGTPHVDPNLLWNLDIPIPPKEIQQHIVEKIEELFSDLDNGIENLKKAKQQLESYKQSVLKAAFEGKLTKEWREQQDDLPTSEELKQQIGEEREKYREQQLEDWEQEVEQWKELGEPGRKPRKPRKNKSIQPLKESELKKLPNLPKKWSWEQMGNIANDVQIGPFGSLLHKADYTEDEIPVINPTNISHPLIEPDYSQTITEEKFKSLKKYQLKKGNVILGRRGEMGRCALVRENEDGWLCGTGSIVIRYPASVNSKFANRFINSKNAVDYLENNATGTTMKNLNQKIISSLPFPLCSEREQNLITNKIESNLSILNQLKSEINKSLQNSEALRQSILKKAFKGKLVQEKHKVEKETIPSDNELIPFNQMQMIGILIDTLEKEFSMAYGEMALAKYLYLIDRIKKYKTGLKFKDWHWGPYDPSMKGLIYKKNGFFKTAQKSTIKIKEEKRETLLKYNIHDRELFEEGVREISQIISKFEGKKSTSRQLELLATVCKVIENVQSTDLKTVRKGMEKWNTEKGDFKNKAAKFSEDETERCLDFVITKGWDSILLNS